MFAVTFEVGEAEMVEFAATGVPATKVTVPVTPVNPDGVARFNVFSSATVDFMVPVVIPEAFVTAAGWTRVFDVPVEANVVEVPLTGLLFASRIVTVTVPVAIPSAVTLVGKTASEEFAAEAGPATNVTVPVTVVSPPGVVMLRVFASAAVETIEPVVTPEAFVTAAGAVIVLPEPVDAKAAATPVIGLFVLSRSVMLTVEEATPLAVSPPEGDPEIVELLVEGAPATNPTVVVRAPSPVGAVKESVFVSAKLEAIVAVATPEAFVTDAGWVSVFPVPVDARVTVVPVTGLLFASFSVIVRVDVVTPSAVTLLAGEAVKVEFATVAGPATNVTVPVTPPSPAGEEMLRVFTSATVDFIVPVACPEAFVTAAG